MQKVESQKLTSTDKSFANDKSTKQTVLVELFTSEGCSSCPPAERVLAKLETEQPFAEAELITLAFHVDYWNNLGWKDKFALPLFTQRQKAYDRKFQTGKIYTPQMIVDGDIEFVGSKMDIAEKAIKKSLENKKAEIQIDAVDQKLKVKITDIPKHEDASVYLAFAEDDLSSDVRRGENAGKNLKHVSVVRILQAIGRIMPQDKSFELETNLQIQTDWKKENLKAIVFVQENKSRKILGVQQLKLSSRAKLH